jgi:hypothetical protein
MRHVVVLVGLLGVCGCGGGGNEGDAGEDRPDVVDDSADRADDDAGEDAAEVAEDVGEEADEVAPVCGNGVVEIGEDCDLLNLDGETCISLGHEAGGTLRCNSTCGFDESFCRNPTCGNDICELGETSSGCPDDCHDGCGDGSCAEDEDQFGCPADCGAVAISAGANHSCALLSDGTLRCWGRNRDGQLGDGANTDSSIPVRVSGLTGAVAVSAGAGLTCAVLSEGTVSCWGDNPTGQLGSGATVAQSNEPVAVAGLSGAVAVATGAGHACVVLSGGAVTCWGVNTGGELGNGTTGGFSAEPVLVEGVDRAVAVSLRGGWNGYSGPDRSVHENTCALLADGTAACWGSGYGNVASVVSGLAGAVSVSTGSSETCVALSDGTASCWDEVESGSSGVDLGGLADVAAVATGGFHSCAPLRNGAATCWGAGGSGELGDGVWGSSDTPPVAVTGIADVVGVSAGGWACNAAGWGGWEGSGGCGEVQGGCTAGPFGLPGSCWDSGHTCAVLGDGTAWCWGRGQFGQLGDGTTTDSNVPIQVAAW